MIKDKLEFWTLDWICQELPFDFHASQSICPFVQEWPERPGISGAAQNKADTQNKRAFHSYLSSTITVGWHPIVVIIAFIWSSFHHDSHIIVFPLSSFHHFIFHISLSSFSYHPWFIIIVFIIFLMSSSSCPRPLNIAVFFHHRPVIYVCLVSSSSPSR